jgi:ABC-2 type transport system ATP-binding protein
MSEFRIRCDRVSCKLDGESALNGFTYTFGRGLTYIVGRAGAGKSTLLKLLTTAGPSYEGTIRCELRKSPLTTWVMADQARVRAAIGYLPQQFTGYPEMTVLRYLRHEADRKGMPLGWGRRELPGLLYASGLKPHGSKPLGRLSGGERRRVGLLQALMHAPRIGLFDEPFEGLDVTEGQYIRYQLEKLSVYSTVVVATNRTEWIDPDSDASVVQLDEGRIVFTGMAREKERLVFD